MVRYGASELCFPILRSCLFWLGGDAAVALCLLDLSISHARLLAPQHAKASARLMVMWINLIGKNDVFEKSNFGLSEGLSDLSIKQPLRFCSVGAICGAVLWVNLHAPKSDFKKKIILP